MSEIVQTYTLSTKYREEYSYGNAHAGSADFYCGRILSI